MEADGHVTVLPRPRPSDSRPRELLPFRTVHDGMCGEHLAGLAAAFPSGRE